MVRVSPDRQRLAVTIGSLTEDGLWLYDLGRETLTPLARGGEAFSLVWTPDGQRLVFDWLKDGRQSLAWQRADGTTPPEVLTPGKLLPSSWTPDGRQLAGVKEPWDVAIATVANGRATVHLLNQMSADEGWPEFSPDGHWLAYVSSTSGRLEVYVRPYPESGRTEMVSIEGGRGPAWHPNGRELFYVVRGPSGKWRMMAVDFAPASPPRIGRPRLLFEVEESMSFGCAPVRCYDVAPDGQRFYVVRTPPPPPTPVVTHVDLMLNWPEELKTKVPTGR